jgi:Predicted membrane protein (DUF2231)
MEILGIPLHPLVVHAAVVLVPLAALGTLIVAFWPQALRRFGWVLTFLSAGGLVGAILARESGEELFESMGEEASSTLDRHMTLGNWVFVPTLVMTVALLAMMLLTWRRQADERPGWLYWVSAVVATLAALASLVLVIMVGHSGATAVWTE